MFREIWCLLTKKYVVHDLESNNPTAELYYEMYNYYQDELKKIEEHSKNLFKMIINTFVFGIVY